MFKCFSCGEVFSEEEVAKRTEDYGESFEECPCCGCAFDEAKQCAECGEYFLDYELVGGMCEDCREEIKEQYRYDVDKCYEVGKSEEAEIKLNCFLSSTFSVEEIEEILLKELKNSPLKFDCKEFIENDEEWFFENILKNV